MKLYTFITSLLTVTRMELETIASQKQGDYLPTAPRITCRWRSVADIPELPPLDRVAAERLDWEKPKEYVSLAVDRQKRLASAFREHMTKDQSYHASSWPNILRFTFRIPIEKLSTIR